MRWLRVWWCEYWKVVWSNFVKNLKRLALVGLDPTTFGLWAQHASSAPKCCFFIDIFLHIQTPTKRHTQQFTQPTHNPHTHYFKYSYTFTTYKCTHTHIHVSTHNNTHSNRYITSPHACECEWIIHKYTSLHCRNPCTVLPCCDIGFYVLVSYTWLMLCPPDALGTLQYNDTYGHPFHMACSCHTRRQHYY